MGKPAYTIEYLLNRGMIPTTWYEDILEIGRQGKAEVSIVNYMNINWDTHKLMMQRSPRYMEAVLTAKKLSEEWWVEIARKEWVKGNSKSINSQHWSLMVRNMFGERWSDRREMDLTSKGDKLNQQQINVEIIKPEIEKDEDEKDKNK